jgi:NAD(P)-dependent dehydrogenase (short-subunit alcohol dehydrogenase family)
MNTPRPRINIITGARSGIGLATADLLRSRGERVIGIDLSDVDVAADLSRPVGRQTAIEAASRACPDGVDALILCAGLAGGFHPGEAVVSVNYFGAVELALGLRALLVRGNSPRVTIVSSSASILPFDENIVDCCLAGDEDAARHAAACTSNEEIAARSGPIYAASKRALSRWIRRTAPQPDWAGSGILMNGVAPGLVKTPMTAPLLETAHGREVLAKAVPRAVEHAAEPGDIALLLAFLASPDNRYMVGQVPFCDGGKDVILRGDAVL